MVDIDHTIVIVGAGRSGTTMMREALSSHSDLACTEYEMNYLWRHGNAILEHDFLDPDVHFSLRKGRYIRKQLKEILENSGKKRLVEKTVANVVRVSYVHQVLPEAKIIHIIRDGRAVVASSMRRWRADNSGGYLLSKSSTIPWSDIPIVGYRYIKNRVLGLLRQRGYTQSWGPKWLGMTEDVKNLSLAAVCAKQWSLSVVAAQEQAAMVPSSQTLEIRYEDLVAEPVIVFERIAQFIGIPSDDKKFRHHIETKIKTSSLAKWKDQLTDQELKDINTEAGTTLEKLGYK